MRYYRSALFVYRRAQRLVYRMCEHDYLKLCKCVLDGSVAIREEDFQLTIIKLAVKLRIASSSYVSGQKKEGEHEAVFAPNVNGTRRD